MMMMMMMVIVMVIIMMMMIFTFAILKRGDNLSLPTKDPHARDHNDDVIVHDHHIEEDDNIKLLTQCLGF